MDQFKDSFLLIISTPIYIILIGLEMGMSYFHEKKYYTLKDTITNVYLSALNGGIDLAFRVFYLAVLAACYQYKLVTIENVWIYWIALLILEDFAFYWLHRFDHEVRFFWAVHVTHHSSQLFNLTVGFRSSVFQPLYRFVYFIPIAFLGFRPEDIMLMYSATQIYGILIHTKYINKLGFLEYFLATPSHHRVHHGSNPRYLDKNMGMVFIFWDKWFGTFQKELDKDPVQYGLTTNLRDYHPLNVVFHEWKQILKDVISAPGLYNKWMYLFGPPGWSHDGSRKTSDQLRAELEP
jgi:sterol desaturase/sphingolipid hydroxylase (fatty acid hydroxylase superfamily)